jgi:hypothetical protein
LPSGLEWDYLLRCTIDAWNQDSAGYEGQEEPKNVWLKNNDAEIQGKAGGSAQTGA